MHGKSGGVPSTVVLTPMPWSRRMAQRRRTAMTLVVSDRSQTRFQYTSATIQAVYVTQKVNRYKTRRIRTGANVKRRRGYVCAFCFGLYGQLQHGMANRIKPIQLKFTGRCPGSRNRGGRPQEVQRLQERQGREIFSSSSCFKFCQISKCASRQWLKFGTKRKCFRHIVANPVPPIFLRKGKFKKP